MCLECCEFLEAAGKVTAETTSEIPSKTTSETTSETTTEEINDKNNDVNDLIRASCINGHLECLKVIIPNKFDVDTQDSDACTALQYTAANGHLDCLKYLLSCGADVNKVNGNHETPLYCAVEYGRLTCVIELLMHNADQTIEDENGTTPYLLSSCLDNLSTRIYLGRKSCNDYFEKLEWKKVLLLDMEKQLTQMSLVHKESIEKLKEEAEVNCQVMRKEISQLKNQLDQVLELLLNSNRNQIL